MVKIFAKGQTKKNQIYQKYIFLINKIIFYGFKVQFDMNRYFVKILDRKNIIKGINNSNLYLFYCKKMNRLQVATFAKFL